MNALDSLLRPAAAMINRQITAKTPARALCKSLADRVMAMRVRDTGLTIYLIITDDQLVLSPNYDQEPDIVVSGSLLSLAKLASPLGDVTIHHGDIELSGDALLAQQFQKLLYFGRPDIEEELARVIGDVAAHGVGEFFRDLGQWGSNAGETMRQNVGEYLQEESRALPSRHEVEGFHESVATLRDDVARFEARLQILESGRAVGNHA